MSKTHTPRMSKAEIAARRQKVATLYLARVSQQVIADQVGCNQATVSRDITWLIAQWQKEALADVTDRRAREDRELDEMEQVAVTNMSAALEVANVFRTVDEDKYYRYMAIAQTWFSHRDKIKNTRYKLMGIAKPTELDILSGGKPLPQAAIIYIPDNGRNQTTT